MRILLIAIAVMSAACTGAPKPVEMTWECQVAIETGTKLGGCAVGDVDARYPGNEIVAVASDGAVHVVHREGDGWRDEVVFRAEGELIQCAIGDVDPTTPSMEIVVGGMLKGGEDDGGPGVVHVIGYTGDPDEGPWRRQLALLDRALVHGVCVHDGAIISVGFSRLIHRIRHTGGEGVVWEATVLGKTPGDGKQVVSTEDGAVIACNDGWVGRVRVTSSGGEVSEVDRRDVARARLGAADGLIAVADDDGVLSLIGPNGREEIFRGTGKLKLRGAVIGDLDPAREGNEVATAGYDRQVVLLRQIHGEWRSECVGRDTDKFHHLASGELGGAPGPELVAVGYSGRILVIGRRAKPAAN